MALPIEAMDADHLSDQAKVVVSHATKRLHDLKSRAGGIPLWRPVAMEVPEVVAETVWKALRRERKFRTGLRYCLAVWRCPDRKVPVYEILDYLDSQLHPKRIERDLADRPQVPAKVAPAQVTADGM